MGNQTRGDIIPDEDVMETPKAQAETIEPSLSRLTVEENAYSTFTPFPRLPFELRTTIWKMSIKPQLILIQRDAEFEDEHEGQARCKVNTTVPAPLHTCHESRTFASRIYKLSFGLQLKGPIYVNNHEDYICFVDLPASKSFHSATRSAQRLMKLNFPDKVHGPEETVNIFLGCTVEAENQRAELLQEALANTTHVFPCARRIMVVGHESEVPLWVEVELLVDLLRTRPNDPMLHSLIMGWSQMIDGELVKSPNWEPPTIEFWREDDWHQWAHKLQDGDI